MKKNPIFRKCLSAMLLLGAAAMPLSAAVDDEAKVVSEDGDTKVVEICGRGLTEKSAIKDATRNAVVFVVGQIVDAQTITQNEDAIEDKIVSVSNGFVDAVQPIEGPENRGGTVLVRVRATVKSGQMKTDIVKLSEMSMDFNPSAAKAALESKVDNVEGMGNFLLQVWDTYIKLFKIEELKHEISMTDETKMIFKLKCSLNSRDFRNVLLKSLRKNFKAMRIKPVENTGSRCLNIWIPGAKAERYDLSRFFPRGDDGEELWKKYVYEKLPQYNLVIECLDEDGEVIASCRNEFTVPNHNNGIGAFLLEGHTQEGNLGRVDSWRSMTIDPMGRGDHYGKFFTSCNVEDQVVQFPTKEDIEDVKTIKIYIEKVLPEEKE